MNRIRSTFKVLSNLITVQLTGTEFPNAEVLIFITVMAAQKDVKYMGAAHR